MTGNRCRGAVDVILVVVVLAALETMVSCSRSEEAQRTDKPSISAQTEVLQLTTVPDVLRAPGTVRARTATVVASRIVGQIVSIAVREGDRVRRYQVLAEIENREADAQLRRAESALAEAQGALQEAEDAIRGAEAGLRVTEATRDLAASTQSRYEMLRERRSISPQEYDEVQTRYKAAVQETERAEQGLSAARARRQQVLSRIDQANAAVEAATVAAGFSRVVSPIDGIVTRRTAEPGMLATPGLPLVAIEDPATYELEVAVEESRVGSVRRGQVVRVEIDGLERGSLEGRVREITASSDPSTRSYTVKIQLQGAQNQRLATGVFGRAAFETGKRQALIILPSALVRRGQLEGVYVVADDIAVFRLVKTGKAAEHGIEVVSGLVPGTRILTTPPGGIIDGSRIIEDRVSGKTP